MEVQLRIGIVGMGNAGMTHARPLIGNQVPRAVLTAVCDARERAESLRKTLPGSVMIFDDYDKMLASGVCDAVIVSTPHLLHPEQSEKALLAGLHVFCEKPAGISIGPVRRLNKLAAGTKKVFAMNFIKRQEPVYQTLKRLIDGGELGRVYRIHWTASDWYRSDSYFSSASWRGSWAGEGGGVLLNQCIHNIDLWQYIFGMPSRLRAFCSFGKYHNIEVEDDVTAYMEYHDGATGVLVTSTGESPGVNRLEVTGSRGRILVENRAITFYRTSVPIEDFNRADKSGFGEPEHWECSIPVNGQTDLFAGMQRNFVEAILDGKELFIRGEDGLASLEIANAILLSTWQDDWASLPVDEASFEAELAARIRTSRKPSAINEQRILDLSASFK
ncbi:MAG: hypothetical protein A2X49_02555 [Lentisphaerae bacterium GWF2_52_8]|nr:MAG: hypothetical protein A2X49_02555 [Lentisphaerae bacterium GWF2_52_8]